jgi:hypothetical protein
MATNIDTMTLPKLEDVCCLVSVEAKRPQMTKTDRKATRAAEDAMNAEAGTGAYHKALYPKPLVQPIHTAELHVRNYVQAYASTLARNLYLLPNSFRQRVYEGGYHLIDTEYKMAVDAFLINYGQVLHAAQQQQGDMFDASVYPDVSEVRAQFRMDLRFLPFAPARNLAADEFGAMLAQRCEVDIKNALRDNLQDILGQMTKVVGSIASKLHTKLNEDGKQARFHDSLMENLDHLIEVVPALNFTNDPRIDHLIDEMKRKLRVPTEVLKSGARGVQERILQDANDILSKMQGLI